jgi:hypothetical protein
MVMASGNRLTAILPCNDLDASEAFFGRLGFNRENTEPDDYRMMSDGNGATIHLCGALEGWLVPGRNPFGLYLYADDVDGLAARFGSEIIERGRRPEHKPWGMYEFSLNAPDETLVRVGKPSRNA